MVSPIVVVECPAAQEAAGAEVAKVCRHGELSIEADAGGYR